MRKSFIPILAAALSVMSITCHAQAVSDKNGLRISFDRSGAVAALSVNGKDILDRNDFSGFDVEDMNSKVREHVTGAVESRNGSIIFSGGNKTLGIRLISQVRSENGYVSLHSRIIDLTKSERAVRVYFTLNVKDLAWNWCEDINNNYPALSGNTNMVCEGFAGHKPTIFPFAAIASADTGLAIGWPMANPRFFTQSFTLGERNSGKLEMYVALGLSSYTDKFPNAADFDTIIYSFDGRDSFRGALTRYYRIFPDYFKTREKRQGIWTLWLQPGIEDYATRMGALYHEAEFDLYGFSKNIIRDHKYGYLSFQYTEPWGIYHTVPKGFKDKYPGDFKAGSDMENPVNRQKLEEYVRSDFGDNTPDDRFPSATRDIVARTIINTAVEGDDKDDWMTYHYFPGQSSSNTDRKGWDSVAFIVNPDPGIPHPNRADLAWNAQIMYTQDQAKKLGTSIDGVYVDSVMFYMAWDRLNFRRDQWKYADYPLVYTKGEDGRYVPVQALALCYSDYLKYLRNKIAKYNWPILANGWSPLYALCASNIDIMGAGEQGAGGADALPDQKYFAQFRALAYRKPLSMMDYALSLSGAAPDPKLADEIVEPRINYFLMYGIYPGTANSFAPGGDTEKKLKIVTPVFEKYRDIFLSINSAGWEPIGAATTQDKDVLLEQWGEGAPSLFYTFFNNGNAPKNVTVIINASKLHRRPSSARELVTGQNIKVDCNGG